MRCHSPLALACVLLVASVACDRRPPETEAEKQSREATEKLAALRANYQPKDPALVPLYRASSAYFKDWELIWVLSQGAAMRLKTNGFDAEPVEIMRGAIEVMQRSEIASPSVSVGEFIDLYEMRRKSNSCEGPFGPSTHRQAIECLIQQRKFDPRYR